jgi:hypothetical protein
MATTPRKKRTDERSFAFENLIDTITLASFKVRILDAEQKPLKGIILGISVDGRDKRTIESDNAGILKVQEPTRIIVLSTENQDSAQA